VPPAADVCGPQSPGWRLCWCGHDWTPTTSPTPSTADGRDRDARSETPDLR
jgi:hypothetical protein